MSSTKIDSLSQESRSFPPSLPLQKRAYLKDLTAYQEMYRRSLEDPNGFWGEIADSFFWFKKWDRVHHYNWKGNIDIRWFEGGKTNICYNALDRHLPKLRDRTAFLWVGNEPGEEKRISYQELWEQVGRAANMLKSLGVKKGDRIAIYMPMIPELPVALLACARIGAIHSVIFGGFSAESLKDRIVDAGCRVILTSDGGFRGPKKIPMKTTVDEAIELCRKAGQAIDHCLVVRRTGDPVPMKPERDLWWHEASENASIHSEAEVIDAEEPLFILYTSGSTGKPKGVLHTTAGYMIYAEQTFKYVFDYHPEDLFWCTADIGWVTGHSYIVYGPLLCGASCILFEGVPNYPHPDRFWEIIERYKVNTFYTAPTAIRALMREGDDWPKRHDLSSLKILGTVGEPINPEAWIWYYEKIGGRRCPVVDTWWQTETGGILITPLPGAMPTKPGSASLPFFGVEPAVLREDGTECETNEGGLLVLKRPWPGIMRTVYGHHERFKETYFSRFPGVYFTGDGARRDEDGYYWLMGRIDDVLNVSGHRIGTAEVESALVSHPSVAEAAVVGFPHEIKGQGIHAYVILKQGFSNSPTLQKELIDHVRKEIGPTAKPDRLQFAPGLPKTRSGKIMRRILRKIAEGKPDEVGDVTTLADPHVVHQLLSQPLEISYDV
ncbi:MAG: acetate--CoA ligase [Deltaproteobacteria bacterium]|nr:acetate--CoA ligase [Deltaproteobacteria bacterium]